MGVILCAIADLGEGATNAPTVVERIAIEIAATMKPAFRIMVNGEGAGVLVSVVQGYTIPLGWYLLVSIDCRTVSTEIQQGELQYVALSRGK